MVATDPVANTFACASPSTPVPIPPFPIMYEYDELLNAPIVIPDAGDVEKVALVVVVVFVDAGTLKVPMYSVLSYPLLGQLIHASQA
jgi:hypothetical protein